MTPDEVVARARELADQEVLLTVRGKVRAGSRFLTVARDNALGVALVRGDGAIVQTDLVDIRPAPPRIVAGQRYADTHGRLFEGDADGGLWELAAGYILAGEVGELDGLRPVKVVDQ